jgi:hypothetical protein
LIQISVEKSNFKIFLSISILMETLNENRYASKTITTIDFRFANPPLMHWVVLFFCLARLSRADYSCLCNYQVELPIFSVMDTTSTPVGYMYEFDCKPVAKVNYATDGFNVIMNEHKVSHGS